MKTLRESCPWDQQQTHETLLKYLLEEAYEAADAIESGDSAAMCEELGDVLLQVFFHAQIASERTAAEGGFTIDDVAAGLAAKLIRRHPHVFAAVTVADAAEVHTNWEEIKKAERAAKAAAGSAGAAEPSALDGVPFGQPALSLAAQLQRRAARAGITVPATDSADSIGDELMALVARANAAGIDPEVELRAAARRYAEAVRAQESADPPA
jgi:XTP/dITP diphosphohydrolase